MALRSIRNTDRYYVFLFSSHKKDLLYIGIYLSLFIWQLLEMFVPCRRLHLHSEFQMIRMLVLQAACLKLLSSQDLISYI